MNFLAIGDVFIPEVTMRDAIQSESKQHKIKTYQFGPNDRKSMRNIVKLIESGDFTDADVTKQILEDIEEIEVLMVHLFPVTREIIEKAKKLKVILSNRGGLENIDLEAAKEYNIKVISNPEHNSNAVAEFTIGQILNESRNITRSHIALENGVWREDFPNTSAIRELRDMTVGIVGLGSVGKLVLEKLCALGCKVLVNTPCPMKNLLGDKLKFEFVSLNDLLMQSDVVTLHARTEKQLIGEKEFALMKRGAYLINNARAHLVDTEALYKALKNRIITGAAIDVYDFEPINKNFILLKLDNITLSNHRAGDTLNAYSDSPKMLMEKLNKYINCMDEK